MNYAPNQSQVLQLSTGHEGGAGLAARRLNSSLRMAGIRSTFCAVKRNSFQPREFEFALERTAFYKLRGKVNARLQSLLSQESFFSLHSSGFINARLLSKLETSNETILHFHNWFNLVSIKQLSQLQSKGYKIFLTMHDERIFTGGCHYSLSCKKFTSSCEKCPAIPKIFSGIPKKNLSFAAKSLMSPINPITLIAPSNWIAGEFAKSALARIFKVEVIPNVHGDLQYLDVRKPNRPVIRLGYASKYSNSWIKGSDFLQALIKESRRCETSFEFIYMSDFEDSESTNSNFWREIDFLLVPSRMDNSPNVIHEARINGVPVIASAVGGITELLSHETDLWLDVESFNPRNLLNKISNYFWSGQKNVIYKALQSQHELDQQTALSKLIKLYGIKT